MCEREREGENTLLQKDKNISISRLFYKSVPGERERERERERANHRRLLKCINKSV